MSTILLINKGKVFYGQEPPVENLLQQNMGSSQWGTPSYSQPQPAVDNDVRDGRSNWLVHPPPSWTVPPERLVHSINRRNLSWTRTCNRSMRGKSPCLCGHSGYKLKETLKRFLDYTTEFLVNISWKYLHDWATLNCNQLFPEVKKHLITSVSWSLLPTPLTQLHLYRILALEAYYYV